MSRAPLAKIAAYQQRMQWRFLWVSSHGSAFNDDFGVSFTAEQQEAGAEYNIVHVEHPMDEHPGLSVFALHGDDVFHTYSTNVGDETYEVPDGFEATDGDWTVLVWCESFNVEFVAATVTVD